MPTVEHFEIAADDVERAQKFYKDVFGWTMQKWSESENPGQEYWFFETKDDKGSPGIGGGMMKRQDLRKELQTMLLSHPLMSIRPK